MHASSTVIQPERITVLYRLQFQSVLVPLLTVLLASGCAQQTRHNANVITGLDHAPAEWSADGKIALRTDEHSSVMRIQWQQSNNAFHIVLSGNFGLGAITLANTGANSGNSNTDVGLWKGRLSPAQLADHEPLRVAGSAEDMLLLETGWRLPVSLLRYWVLGLPSPEASNETATKPDIAPPQTTQLPGFSQAGWTVSYPAVTVVDGLALPRKMRVRADSTATMAPTEGQASSTVSIKASFSDWHLGSPR